VPGLKLAGEQRPAKEDADQPWQDLEGERDAGRRAAVAGVVQRLLPGAASGVMAGNLS
jgi:hypothetical protein